MNTYKAMLAFSLTIMMVGYGAVADSRMEMDGPNEKRDPKCTYH